MIRIRTKHIIQSIVWSLLFLFVLSCEWEQKPEPVQFEDFPETVSFSEHIIPILEGLSIGIELTGKGRDCRDCHAGSVPPDLTVENAFIELTASGYVDVSSPDNSKLLEKIDEGGSMNPYTNHIDIQYIRIWIEQGALEN